MRSIHRFFYSTVQRVPDAEGYFLWTLLLAQGISALLFRFSRSGMIHFGYEELQLLILAYTIISVPIFLAASFRLNSPMLLVLSYLFLIFFVPSWWVICLFFPIIALLLIYHAAIFFRFSRAFMLFPAILIAGLFLGLVAQTEYQLNFISMESSLLNTGYVDSKIEAAFAGILGTFGRWSMGFDGLIPRTYHFFSYLWAGKAIQLLNLPPIHTTALLANILFFPLLALSQLWFSIHLLKNRCASPLNYLTGITVICFGICYLCAFDEKPFISIINYVFSIGTLMLSLTWWLQRTKTTSAEWGVSLVLQTALVFAKVSVGFAWLAFVSLDILTDRNQPKLKRVFAVGLHAIAAIIAYKFVEPMKVEGGLHFSFLHFIHSSNLRPTFYLTHNFFAIIFGVLFFMKRKHDPESCVVDVRFVVIAYAVLVLCHLPGLFLEILGGSAWYFSNIPAWIFLGFLTAELSQTVTRFFRTNHRLGISAFVIGVLTTLVLVARVQRNGIYSIFSTKIALVNEARPGAFDKETIARSAKNVQSQLTFIRNANFDSLYSVDAVNLLKFRTLFQKYPHVPIFIPWSAGQYWNNGWTYLRTTRVQVLTGHYQVMAVNKDPNLDLKFLHTLYTPCGSQVAKLYRFLGQTSHQESLCQRGNDIQPAIRNQREEAEKSIEKLCSALTQRMFDSVIVLSDDLSTATIHNCRTLEPGTSYHTQACVWHDEQSCYFRVNS